MTPDSLNLCAGPGGWEVGARIIGRHHGIVGIEVDPAAVATATAAGHHRMAADILTAEPADYPATRGCIVSTPCPTFSSAGCRSGLGELQTLLDVISHAGAGDCACTWDEIAPELTECSDPRTALAAQTIRWALGLPALEWLAFEQVWSDGVAYMFEDIAAELFAAGWESADVFRVDAHRLGLPVRRSRAFLVARRYGPLGVVEHPAMVEVPAPTMADVLGWPTGHTVRTRGARRPTGGNTFSADGVGWCLTEKARSWKRDADGRTLIPAEAGRLQGFPSAYPWTGSRSRRFHQLADVVVPPVAAAVLGYATGTRWVESVRDYLEGLYGEPAQLGLFEVST